MSASSSRWTPRALVGTITRSVWRWQLVLTFCVVIMGAAVALLDPSWYGDAAFLCGMVLIVLVAALTLAVHWARFSKRAVLAVPLVDIVAIGLLASAAPTLGFLWFFPVTWIATYYGIPTLSGALALVLAMQIPGWLADQRSAESTLTALIVMLSLVFLGITITTGTRRTLAFRHLMRRQSRQLDRALQRVRAQEQRTRGLFDALGIALVRVDDDGHVIAANAAYRALYSLSEQDLDQPPRAIEYDGYRGRALPPDRTAIARAARGERTSGERLWLYDATGTWRALTLTTHARAGAGALLELADDTANVTSGDGSRSAISAISHELRNPLTAILGHADLLLDTADLTPRQREHATVIESAAERMLTLVRRLLDNRPAEPTVEPFDLGDLAVSALAAFTPSASAAELTMTGDIAPDLSVTGDAFRMRQVIDNILSNAIKYTPRSGRVEVKAAREGDRVRLSISDSGIGIADDEVAKVFDPYFRAHSALDGGISGTGLGMGISREIVRQHHGDIALRSALGHGTTATITLPLTRDQDACAGAGTHEGDEK